MRLRKEPTLRNGPASFSSASESYIVRPLGCNIFHRENNQNGSAGVRKVVVRRGQLPDRKIGSLNVGNERVKLPLEYLCIEGPLWRPHGTRGDFQDRPTKPAFYIQPPPWTNALVASAITAISSPTDCR